MKFGSIARVVLAVIVTGIFARNSTAADGDVAVPYTNTFEVSDNPGSFVGYPIISNVGWGVAYDMTNAAVITNWPSWSSNYPSPYLPYASHSNVLDIAGTVSNVLAANVYDYMYIDVCVIPQLRDSPPTDQVTPAPQAAAYVNSQSNLVFYYRWWDMFTDPAGYLPPVWETNTWVTIPTGEWVRLTFEIAFNNYGPVYYGDSFYRIRINDSPNYYTNEYSYNLSFIHYGFPWGDVVSDPQDPAPSPREWFMCANTAGDGWPQHSLLSFTVSGSAQIDDYVVAGQSTILINNTNVLEGDVAETTSMVFTVSLSAPEAAEVPVAFATADGTAVAGVDYEATNGIIQIPPGQLSTSVTVTVYGNAALTADRDFYVNLNRPANLTVIATGTGTITEDDYGPSYTSHGTPTLWLDSYGLGGDYEVADTNDVDGDGATAWHEYWTGTIPTNRESVFKFVSLGTNNTLVWLGGTNALNPPWLIQRATNLLGDPASVWTTLPSTNYARMPDSEDGTNIWTDLDFTSYPPRRLYYRVLAPTNAP